MARPINIGLLIRPHYSWRNEIVLNRGEKNGLNQTVANESVRANSRACTCVCVLARARVSERALLESHSDVFICRLREWVKKRNESVKSEKSELTAFNSLRSATVESASYRLSVINHIAIAREPFSRRNLALLLFYLFLLHIVRG
jgi:hypothetical protein